MPQCSSSPWDLSQCWRAGSSQWRDPSLGLGRCELSLPHRGAKAEITQRRHIYHRRIMGPQGTVAFCHHAEEHPRSQAPRVKAIGELDTRQAWAPSLSTMSLQLPKWNSYLEWFHVERPESQLLGSLAPRRDAGSLGWALSCGTEH